MRMFLRMKLGFTTSFFSFLITVSGGLLSAVYMTDLWAWFVVPLGAPTLKFWHAYGLHVFVRYLTFHADSGTKLLKLGILDDADRDATSKERAYYLAYTFVLSFIMPLAAYLFGYIAHRLG